MGVVTGKSAKVAIYSGSTHKDQSVWGISDFSLTLSRGSVEQSLVGQTGNWFDYGKLSVDGSLTNCRFAASGNSDALSSIIDSAYITVSGSTGSNFSFYFVSCQVTSYEVTLGDADTISEVSIDYTVMDPFNISSNVNTGHISDVW